MRPWQERWQAALKALEDLERTYSGWSDGPGDSKGWKIPIDFCNVCFHLMDWINKDPAVSPTVQSAVLKIRDQHAAIKLTGPTVMHVMSRP
ncbi:hypothetical protein E2C00_33180 [Streptomyces sp. WAC05374]|uniref:hypothetical protein n=1 Tax=Streptomyces sp. WAC05374 TaxID=2487420 RepID=UPI000F866789|nr:hypothetical protein [Streptomyces sp. WAC05374]RST16901.1 hypothetical protein EF905_11195 [Streptomyces sp. WAC05374]TDF35327.1 hypothetical protein E2B92_32360 [Streptomyces sp. WAC05374]TDF46273.1 hypothetical protein E2C02_32120 [Streptomyces sp. WAC05374]TDF46904.1 hypothetical protein E2C00_33180 [Streptomyces sp. WAC05374]